MGHDIRRDAGQAQSPRAKADRISRLMACSSVVTTRYFRERISRYYHAPRCMRDQARPTSQSVFDAGHGRAHRRRSARLYLCELVPSSRSLASSRAKPQPRRPRPLDEPGAVASLLDSLREAGADE
jgi:hypothetical protein